MGELFGTDGIRGVANEYPITPEMALKVGRAAAHVFKVKDKKTRIVIAKDSRVSGDMLEHAVASGLCSAGADALLAGILPTPGLAFLAKSMSCQAGIMISASHNPFCDNGIKFFKGDGLKLSDEEEREIEALILETQGAPAVSCKPESIGCVSYLADAEKRYIEFLKSVVSGDSILKGLRVVLDCSNGATSRVAPVVFTALGAEVTPLFAEPDGTNINRDCGSEHTERLAEAVVKNEAVLGFAFDGDGDRVIAVDENGERVSGDKMLAICAKGMKEGDCLAGDMVVSTVMSNIGLGLALKGLGIEHITTGVGDRYVLQEMLAKGASIGGEDSGHMIFLEHHTTGDGIIAALKVAETMSNSARPLSELAGLMTVFPQVLINVEVKAKPLIDTVPEIVAAVERAEKALGVKGRVLVRYSGTQSMCRVMVEGPTTEETERLCAEIAGVVKEVLG